MKYKQSVLTYLFGEYEMLHEIQQMDDDTEYILVTDNPNLTSNTWTIEYRDDIQGNNYFDKVCYVRYHPFEFVHTDVVLKIDGSIEIKKSLKDFFDKYYDGKYQSCLMIHPNRDNVVDEYNQWIKGRNYSAEQAEKCKKYITDTIGLPLDYKGLYQVGFWCQTNNDYNNNLNKETLEVLKKLGENGLIERLDQTIFSAILNAHYQSDNILFVDETLITNSPFFSWKLHNTNTNIPMKSIENTIQPFAFNKRCHIEHFKKKLLILSMSCNKKDFVDEENAIRDTWVKPILNNKYIDVDWYSYRGGASENFIDEKNHIIWVKSKDDFENTFYKTQEVLNTININQYDWILRTNCCVYININALLSTLNQLYTDVIYTNEIVMYPSADKHQIHYAGAFMLTSSMLLDRLNKVSINNAPQDDVAYSLILNSLYKEDYIYHIKQLSSSYFSEHKKNNSFICLKCKSFNDFANHYNVNVVDNLYKAHKLKKSFKKAIVNKQFLFSQERKFYPYSMFNLKRNGQKKDFIITPIHKTDAFRDKSADELKCAIFCIVKNENRYLREWVDYHLKLGFDKIYINDNNDIEGEKPMKVLKDYVLNGQVVILNRRGEDISKIGEDTLYNECLNMFGNDYGTIYKLGNGEWIYSIDDNGNAKVKYKEYNKSLEEKNEYNMINEDNTKMFILGYKNFDCPVHNSKLYSIVDLKTDSIIKDGYTDENGKTYHYDIPIIYTDKKNTISDKNDIYDEWTGIYWLWKNYNWKDVEYIGLCQYRRYFEFLDEPAWDVLQKTDIAIGGCRQGYILNNAEDFRRCHNINELQKLLNCIAPDDVEATNTFLTCKDFYPSNLVLMSKSNFFDYCAFIFGYIKKYQVNEGLYCLDDILTRVMGTLSEYPTFNGTNTKDVLMYQRQLLAFLMERLSNIWIHKKILAQNVMRVSCVETEKTGQNIFKYVSVDKIEEQRNEANKQDSEGVNPEGAEGE